MCLQLFLRQCRSSQEESEELAQALQASEMALKEARRDAAAHEDAAGDFLEELDETRAEKAALVQQLADAKVSCTMTACAALQALAVLSAVLLGLHLQWAMICRVLTKF